MLADVAIYAVVRIVIPQVTGLAPEDLILSALKTLPLVTTLPPGEQIVKYEISERRPGGATKSKQVFIDQDHLDLLETELGTGAEIFNLALHIDPLPAVAPVTLLQHPSVPVVVQ